MMRAITRTAIPAVAMSTATSRAIVTRCAAPIQAASCRWGCAEMAPKPTRNPVEWRARAEDAPLTAMVRGERVPLGRIEFLMRGEDGTRAHAGEWVPVGFLRYTERDAWQMIWPNDPRPEPWSHAHALMVGFDPGAQDGAQERTATENDGSSSGEANRATVSATVPESSGDAIADAIRGAIAAAASGAVDADMVRDMIQQELRSMPAPVVHVTLPNMEPITIEGTLHAQFETALTWSWAGLNVYLPGPPGTGKTTLAQQVAQAMGIDFRHLSCHPQMTGVSLFGYMDAQGRYVGTDFRHCYEHGGLFLLDEADNGNGAIIAALNAAIENGHCSFPDGPVKRHDDFRIICAANTYGHGATAEFAGRNKLDAATLNRFAYLPVEVDETVEEAMVLAECDPNDPKSVQAGIAWLAKVRACRANLAAANLTPRRFVTPRDARDGARIIRLGGTEQMAAEAKMLAGLDETARAKMTQGVKFDG